MAETHYEQCSYLFSEACANQRKADKAKLDIERFTAAHELYDLKCECQGRLTASALNDRIKKILTLPVLLAELRALVT